MSANKFEEESGNKASKIYWKKKVNNFFKKQFKINSKYFIIYFNSTTENI